MLLALAVAAGVLGALVAVQRDEALPGVRVGPVAAGGLGSQDLQADLTARLAPAYRLGVLAQTGSTALVDPVALGVRLDVEATARRALAAGRGSVPERIAALLGRDRQVAPVVTLDDGALAERVAALAASVAEPAFPGGLQVDPASLAVHPLAPRPGRALDTPAATAALRRALLAPGVLNVDLPVRTVATRATPERVAALAATAERLLSGPVLLEGGGASVAVPAPALAGLLRTDLVDDAGLSLGVDAQAAAAVLEPLLDAVRRPATNAALTVPAATPLLTDQGDARFRARPAPAELRPARDGLAVDTAAAVQALQGAVGSGSSAAGLPVQVLAPAVPTSAYAGIDQVIGSFTTGYPCCRPRATNIARMAELVDGTVVAPGEAFSLNAVAGERTRARGFVADGAIVDGELVDEVGGGVSQFSTTLYNAVWFAGLPVLEHQPHSRYIARYPPGREATLYWRVIDNRWRNDTGAPVLVRASTTPSSVTVTLYGHTGDRLVVSETGVAEPRPDGGFRIAYSRRVIDGGKQTASDRRRWTYAAPLT